MGHAALVGLPIPFANRAAEGSSLFGGGELIYKLLPVPDLLSATRQLPSITGLQVTKGLIKATVWGPIEMPLNRYGPILFYYFDHSLNFEELVVGDTAMAYHDSLQRFNILDHMLDQDEIEKWKNIKSFETMPDGNSREVREFFQTAKDEVRE